ncbi:hypothetical protein ACTZWW_07350 [Salinarimonas sp. NSM]|uniref:hypothetical protein n=1 Tax=Salinarimonas sp. NSM TaxID=3458003 RepID=UPI004035FCBF
MSGNANFNRVYIDFGSQVRDFEKAVEVLAVVDFIQGAWGYGIGNLAGAKFGAQWLRAGENAQKREEDLDLILQMVDAPFFEIVLRDGANGSRYGGWLEGGLPLQITDEVVNGYRVLTTTLADGSPLRHEFVDAELGYQPVPGAAAVPLRSQKRKGMRKAS